MKRRHIAFILAVLLTISCLCTSVLAASGMGNFRKIQSYDNRFTDINGYWFYSYVSDLYEYGMVTGRSDTVFDPYGNVTVAEGVTLASRIHAIYHGKAIPTAEPGQIWYEPYTQYAAENGIMYYPEYGMDISVTRWELAVMLYCALPKSELKAINNVTWIPDVHLADLYGEIVYTLYNAGVLTGSDGGRFKPNDAIIRAEAMTMVSRLINPALRQSVVISQPELVDGTYQEWDNTSAPGNRITFYPATKTFDLYVNLFEGYGYIYGDYEIQAGEYIYCTVTKHGFSGFLGDDIAGLTFRHTGNEHIVLISATKKSGETVYTGGRLVAGALGIWAELYK